MKTRATHLLASLTLIMASQTGLAYNEQQGGSERRGPPPEAYSACENMSAGEQAQFVSPRGNTVSGICEENNGTLVLRPDHKKANGKRRSPPPEAYDACEGKSVGDETQFEDRRGETLTGSCEEDNGKLVLRPQRSGPPA